jgi:hypothetical protein
MAATRPTAAHLIDGSNTLPAIVVSSRQLRDVTTEALSALQQSNDPPRLFVRSARPVHVIRDEKSRYVISDITEHALRGYLSRSSNYLRVTPKGREVECSPPMEVVRDILALSPDQWQFLPLSGVTEAPVLRPDGTVLDTPGYDPSTYLVYAPSLDLYIPPVPSSPTAADITKARDTLLDIVAEFDFIDVASKINAVAALLTPICRPAIDGHVPMAIIDATDPGSGKSLLAEVISLIATGRDGAMFSAPTEDAEWRKQLTSALQMGTVTIVIDNVTRRLDSAELCKVLTESTHADRLLGTNTIVTLPVLAFFLATGNAVQVGGDMPRRVFWIRLNPKCSQPFRRTAFKYPDLKGHVTAHRGELLQAALTLARSWVGAGCPKPTVTPIGSFENWTIVVGGILTHAQLDGFLANAEERYRTADTESLEWETFLLTLHETFKYPFTVAADAALVTSTRNTSGQQDEPEEVKKLRESLPEYIAEASDRPGVFSRRLGIAFRQREGRHYGDSGVHILRTDLTQHHAVSWEVIVAKPESAKTDPVG